MNTLLRPFRTRLGGIQPATTTSNAQWTFSPPPRHLHTSRPTMQRTRQTHYDHLELDPSADRKRIKSQFYRLSKLHHPDKSATEESRQRFLKINEAYSILGNERSRFEYDLSLKDQTGSLYSSSSASGRTAPNRGTLRRTPFRHSPHSAAAASAAQQAAAQRAAAFRPSFGQEAPSYFDAKAHQEMHYEQEIRHQERLKKRQKESEEYHRQQKKESEDSWTGKILRVTFLFLIVIGASSLSKVFADEKEEKQSEDDEKQQIMALWECRSSGAANTLLHLD